MKYYLLDSDNWEVLQASDNMDELQEFAHTEVDAGNVENPEHLVIAKALHQGATRPGIFFTPVKP